MYKVLETFRDKQTGFVYYKGDLFPKAGIVVNDARIKELKGKNNAFKKPLIEDIVKEEKQEDEKPAKKTAKKTKETKETKK